MIVLNFTFNNLIFPGLTIKMWSPIFLSFVLQQKLNDHKKKKPHLVKITQTTTNIENDEKHSVIR